MTIRKINSHIYKVFKFITKNRNNKKKVPNTIIKHWHNFILHIVLYL